MFNFFYFPLGIGLLIGSCLLGFTYELPGLNILIFFNLAILTLYTLIVLYLPRYLSTSFVKLLSILTLIMSFGVFGFSLALYQAYQHKAWVIKPQAITKLANITGTVEGLPIQNKNTAQFDLLIDSIAYDNLCNFSGAHHSKICVFWSHPTQQLKPGDKLAFKAILSPIHSLFNPNSFDFEKQSLLTKVRANAKLN